MIESMDSVKREWHDSIEGLDEAAMTKCELLAPAGSPESFIAAAESGADAVYLGTGAFNARMNAENFSEEELKEALDFAGIRGIKTYVTMNTLIREEEVREALRTAYRMYEMGADALIIQDPGLGYLVRKHIPEMEMHLSTQGSIYSLEGVVAARKLGYERVVLARELTLKEIERICAGTDVEIEVFVHGALCISYSGQCQLSRYFGGRSGNRGQCAQPCRLAYDLISGFEGEKPEGRHILSPKDLCMVDRIPDLIEAGVSSLKIEGRMKSPEYVATVTSIYRKYMDMYYEKGKYEVSEDDRESLLQIYNRGGFTEGYAHGDPGRELMSSIVPKNSGLFMGTVTKAGDGRGVVTVRPSGKKSRYGALSFGDRIEIRGRKNASVLVTYVEDGPEGLVRIGDVKTAVSPGDRVYRITSAAQIKEAEGSFKNKTFSEGKFIRKRILDGEVKKTEDGRVGITLRDRRTGREVSMESEVGQPAADGASARDRIEKALTKTGGTPFVIDRIKWIKDLDLFIPVSAVNKMRRGLLSQMTETLMETGRKPAPGAWVMEDKKEPVNGRKEPALEICFYSVEDFEKASVRIRETGIETRCLIPLARIIEKNMAVEKGRDGFSVIPYITAISKGPEDGFIEENFEKAAEIGRINGIYLGNLHWVDRFSKAGVRIYADSGFNVYNRYAPEPLRELGVEEGAFSAEVLGPESGAVPLMISEHRFGRGLAKDRKEMTLRFRESPFGGKTIITPDVSADIDEAVRRAKKEKRTIRVYI